MAKNTNYDDTVAQSPVSEEEAPVRKTVEVIRCGKLNLRSAPNKNASVVSVVDGGARLSINPKFQNKDYYEVRGADGSKAYGMKLYLSVVGE